MPPTPLTPPPPRPPHVVRQPDAAAVSASAPPDVPAADRSHGDGPLRRARRPVRGAPGPDGAADVPSAVRHRALSHPTRHELLARVSREPATISALAAVLDLGKGTVAHHLAVLRSAGMVAVTEKRHVRGGTEHRYAAVTPQPECGAGTDPGPGTGPGHGPCPDHCASAAPAPDSRRAPGKARPSAGDVRSGAGTGAGTGAGAGAGAGQGGGHAAGTGPAAEPLLVLGGLTLTDGEAAALRRRLARLVGEAAAGAAAPGTAAADRSVWTVAVELRPVPAGH